MSFFLENSKKAIKEKNMTVRRKNIHLLLFLANLRRRVNHDSLYYHYSNNIQLIVKEKVR